MKTTKAIVFTMIVIGSALLGQAAGAAEPSTSPATQPSPQPAKELTLDLGNNVSMKLALIPAGKFLMGAKNEEDLSDDEAPLHNVTISKPFYMGIYPVTQSQWAEVMATTLAQQRDKANKDWPFFGEGADNPIYYVSWEEAAEFCTKLSKKTGRTVKLPTEAQWEYACRAGSRTKFGFGANEEDFGDYAWYTKNSDEKTHPVGQKKPNTWGLYDMHGNVWEWCRDWYDKDYYSATGNVLDPQGPEDGAFRVLRGGCWGQVPLRCRSASRMWDFPAGRGGSMGFRVIVDLK